MPSAQTCCSIAFSAKSLNSGSDGIHTVPSPLLSGDAQQHPKAPHGGTAALFTT